jgi:hypothetical protein
VTDAPNSGNRGKVANHPTQDESEGTRKSSRRRISSNTEDELQVVKANTAAKEQVPQKRGGPSNGASSSGISSDAPIERTRDKKRGRPSGSHAALTNISADAQKSSMGGAGPSVRPQIDEETPATKPAKPRRSDRPSDTHDELEMTGESTARKMGRSNAQNVDGSAAQAKKGQDVEADQPVRRGRSSNTEAEVQAIFDEATRVRLKQMSYYFGELYANTLQIQRGGNKSKQHPDTDGRAQTSSFPPQVEVPHQRRTQRSNAGIEETFIAEQPPARPPTRSQGSNTVLAVETATSAFAKDRNKGKPREEPVRNVRRKTTTTSSVAEPSRSRKVPQSDATASRRPANKVDSFKSKNASSNDPSSRKRKHVEGLWHSFLLLSLPPEIRIFF